MELTEQRRTALAMAFEHFYHLDTSNAAIHMATVRYSPITFALAEMVGEYAGDWDKVRRVLGDAGAYEPDQGR